MPIAVDLFAGTGSATRAFRDSGRWDVVEIDREAPPARIDGRWRVQADARDLPISGPVDFLWASPPCTEFSDANPNRPAEPSLDLIFSTLAAVARLRPRFWILENVRGAIPFLGIPVQKIGPFCLWGYFPPLDVSEAAGLYRKDVNRVRSPRERARIPDALSSAALDAVERALDLPALLDLRPWRRHRHVRRPNRAQLAMDLP